MLRPAAPAPAQTGPAPVLPIQHSMASAVDSFQLLEEFTGYNHYVEQYNQRKLALMRSREESQANPRINRSGSTVRTGRSGNVTVLYANANIPLKEGSHTFYAGNCTRYVASQYTVPWTGDAGEWLDNASASGYETKSTPDEGDIFVSDESSYGHVGIVKEVDEEKGVMIVEEMNYKGYGVVSQREVPLDSDRVKGYIKPDKDEPESEEAEVAVNTEE